jgi:hypothetical protein
MLVEYCLATKLQYETTRDVLGIATEPGQRAFNGPDLIMVDHAKWGAQETEAARQVLNKRGRFFQHSGQVAFVTTEYPVGAPPILKLGARKV